MRTNDEAGFTIIEVVLAAAIMLGVVLASIMSISSISRAAAANTRRDQASTVAYRVLERAKAFGCGLATGSATGNETNVKLTALRNKCWSSLSDASVTDAGYTAAFRTLWSTTNFVPSTCAGYATAQPDTLIRRVSVAYKTHNGGAATRTVATREALPPDAAGYNLTGRGGIIVGGVAATQTVTLRAQGTSGFADVTRGPDAAGCVWFPFLAPGNYSLTNSAGTPSYATQVVVAGTQNSI